MKAAADAFAVTESTTYLITTMRDVFTMTGPGAAATTTRRLLRFLEPEGQGTTALVYEREEAVLSVWWKEGEAAETTV